MSLCESSYNSLWWIGLSNMTLADPWSIPAYNNPNPPPAPTLQHNQRLGVLIHYLQSMALIQFLDFNKTGNYKQKWFDFVNRCGF